MANLTIKDLPDSVHRKLKALAKAEGRSMNGLVRELLEACVHRDQRRRLMAERSMSLRRLVATLPPMPSSVELIHEGREERG